MANEGCNAVLRRDAEMVDVLTGIFANNTSDPETGLNFKDFERYCEEYILHNMDEELMTVSPPSSSTEDLEEMAVEPNNQPSPAVGNIPEITRRGTSPRRRNRTLSREQKKKENQRLQLYRKRKKDEVEELRETNSSQASKIQKLMKEMMALKENYLALQTQFEITADRNRELIQRMEGCICGGVGSPPAL